MRLRQYLLGLVSEEEQNEIEECYFADDEYFETMLAAEDELAEAYACGELSRRERKRFDECLLPNPRWRQKIETIRALQHVVNEKKTRLVPEKIGLLQRLADWWREFTASLFEQKVVIGLAYATLLVLLVINGAWREYKFQNFQHKIVNLETEQGELAQQGEQLRQQLAQQTDVANEFADKFEQEKQQRLKLEQLLDKMKPQPTPMLAFALEPGLLRDATSQRRLVIPANVQMVKLDLFIETENFYNNYHATLKTVEGDEMWSQIGLMAQKTVWGQSLNLNLPTISFNNDDYILTLSGITPEGKTEILHRYFFSVVRK